MSTEQKDPDRHLICGGCGLKDSRVEAGGVYYCPNPACRASGASWFKHKLNTFENLDNSSYKVDPDDLVLSVNEWLLNNVVPIEIELACERSLALIWSEKE
jgi:hypothetical protein